MVPVILSKKDEIISSATLNSAFLCRYFDIVPEHINENDFSGNNKTAFKGYAQIIEAESVVKGIIERPPIKGIDYSNNIYCFIGIHLASNGAFFKDIKNRFESFSLKNRFALSLFFNECEKWMRTSNYTTNSDPYNALLDCLFFKDTLSVEDEKIIFDQLSNNENADAIDVALYDKLSRKFTSFKYKDFTSVDLIKNVFINFQDSIKHITSVRRKGHDSFSIRDEYDIQDLSYLVLRSIFKDLEFENPHFKLGGTNSKVDLMIENEGVDIELKMIKDSDKDEKEFIKQLKIDFNDYATWKGLKDLIVFVYDPHNKTTNRNNFYILQGEHLIQGVRFNVHIIVSN